MSVQLLLLALPALAVGLGAGYYIQKKVTADKIASAQAKAEATVNEARAKAQEIELQAKKKSVQMLDEAKRDEAERRKDLNANQQRLEKRESMFDKQLLELQEKTKKSDDRAKEIEAAKAEIDGLKLQMREKLEKVAELPREAAREQLFKAVEDEAQDEILSRIRKIERAGTDEYEIKARNILSTVISRVASSHCAETTTTQVQLPSDDMKGRIIGKEGRNIKSLEQLTGTEIIVDDTPNAITVSGFSPIRRQVARLALESLIKDGRIQPTKIEEAIEEAKRTLALDIKKAGEDAMIECGIPLGSVDPKLISILGRLKYRTSYGQNVLRHSIEVALIGNFLAKEVGADAAVLLKGGLFHDVGKAVDHDVPGAHPEIGYNIMKKFGFPEDIAYHSLSHHEDRPRNIEGYLCKAADAISGSRPGARKDTLENYVRRLEDLEKVATSFEAVDRAYAIQAGREIRVFVSPQRIDDLGAWQLAKDIAKKCEQELQYPGEIKINVIREMRAIEYAR
ncbi:MAG TPA: ribonuclease Y [Candidatus Baltobacteraceae bacterium]|nr:ribonuclease Y [Candidatus Baltobacteraceae bacterium]